MTTADTRVPLVVSERDSDDTGTLCERVVRCVAAASNTPATELPPLQYAVETAALSGLYERPDTAGPTVAFGFAGFHVSIDPDATVAVYEGQARGVESATD